LVKVLKEGFCVLSEILSYQVWPKFRRQSNRIERERRGKRDSGWLIGRERWELFALIASEFRARPDLVAGKFAVSAEVWAVMPPHFTGGTE